jgi:hypothetical protein
MADFGALQAVFAFICLCSSCKRHIQPPSLSLRLNSYGIVPLTSFAELHVGSASLKSSTPCRIAGCGEIGSSRAWKPFFILASLALFYWIMNQLYHEIMRTSYHDRLKTLEQGRTIGKLVVNPRERFNLEQKQSKLLVKHYYKELLQKQALRQLFFN